MKTEHIALGLGVLAVVLALFGSSKIEGLAGTTNFDALDVADGYSVDGTTVIDGSGNVDAPITSSTATFSSTVDVTGAATFSSTVTVAELFTQGGGWFSTSTTGTLTEAQMLANNGIYITAAGAGQAVLALTLPATSTMTTLLATAGDCATWFIDASDVAAATTTTIVKGTGWDLVGLDATGAGTGADVIDGAEFGQLTACRQSDTDVVGYITEWIAAD